VDNVLFLFFICPTIISESYGSGYYEYCEFQEHATAEITGLTAAEGKSFYLALTSQDSFGALSFGQGERERKRKKKREKIIARNSQPLLERIGGVSATRRVTQSELSHVQWLTDAIAVVF